MDRSILVENKTDDASLTLYIYCSWDPLCWLSYSSKIINAGGKYLYRCESSFKFEIKAKTDKKKMKTLCSTRMWEKDTLFRVTGSKSDPKVEEKDLLEYPQEKQLCARRQNMEKEISVDCGRNLYEILRLNMKEVRGKESEEQNEMIKKAFHREIRRWHPDRNPEVVDDHICGEILMAYDILRDPEKRARYNNEADYNNGWLSVSRWKSIFLPDRHTEEQNKEYTKRKCLMALSFGLVIGGTVLTVLTAGMAAPVAIGCTVVAGALIGGGVQSGIRTTNRDSVVDGCDFKKYLMSLGIGAIGGAALGGAGAGIFGALGGAGNAAVQYLASGTATGSVGGVISSVANDIDKKLVSEEDVTWKQVLCHAVAGGFFGGAVGLAGGAVTYRIVGAALAASAGSVEQKVLRRLALRLALARNARALTEGVTGSVLETSLHFTEERLDDSAENRPPGDHAWNTIVNAAKPVATEGGKTLFGFVDAERKRNKLKKSNEGKNESPNNEGKYDENIDKVNSSLEGGEENQCPNLEKKCEEKNNGLNSMSNESKQEQPKQEESQKNPNQENETKKKDFFANTLKAKYIPTFDGPKPEDEDEDEYDESAEAQCNLPFRHLEAVGRIRYISEGYWKSKMIVEYVNDWGKKVQREVRGSGQSIMLPEEARDVKVWFEILRFTWVWCFVKKYDRLNKCWCEPTERHTFKYERPVERTFTIGGSLYYEAVIKVTDGTYQELDEM